MPSLQISTEQIKRFAAQVKTIDEEVSARLKSAVADAGELVAGDARRRAEGIRHTPDPEDGHSITIAASIKVRALAATARITAGGPNCPYAALYEGPNAFYHPTYGHLPWIQQPARPFLKPAVEAKAVEAREVIVNGVDQAFLEVLG